jgi:hypothetical protein
LRELSFVAAPVCFLAKILGLNCAGSQNTLFVQSAKDILGFTTTLEKMGVYEWLNLSVAAVIVILLLKARSKGRTIAFVTLAGLLYLTVRFMMLILLYLNFENMRIFWNPWLAVASFVPLVAYFWKTVPFNLQQDARPLHHWSGATTDKRKLISISLGAFSGIFLIVASWGLHDPGIMKKGRIIIDEKHSNWEWTTRKYDTRWFGMKSGYNYYCLADYLGYFYKVDANFKPIDADMLRNCDILIVKTPTAAFSANEIVAIRKFVRDGGGLFLIGDHTNVFGTSTYINPLAKPFGIRFEHNSTHDLKTGNLSIFRPPRLLPHPIVQDLTVFLFGSSCTLDVTWAAEDVIMGYGLKSLKADYSQKNFFNAQTESPAMEFGQFVQSAGVKYGNGRVLAFTDSTVFSNFWIHLPGKPELLLGSINWLNRRNYIPYNFNSLLLVAGLLCLLADGLYVRYRLNWLASLPGTLFLLFALLLGFLLSTMLFSVLNRWGYSPPKPHTKLTRINFDLGHSDIFLPVTELVSNPARSYHTFYVWVQRLGYVPSAVSTIGAAVTQGDMVIIINPAKHFTKREKDQLTNYVLQGGKLIIMDTASNRKSTANEIIQDFGMQIKVHPFNSVFFHDSKGRKISTTEHAARIEGGHPLLQTAEKETLLAYVRAGKGVVAVFADAMLFADRVMGTTGIVPSAEQLKVYELEFWLLQGLNDSNIKSPAAAAIPSMMKRVNDPQPPPPIIERISDIFP